MGSLALTIIGTSILLSLTSLPAVIGQANGSKDYRLARIYLHRQYVITAVGSLIVVIPLLFIKPILLSINQDTDIVDLAAMYVYYCIPGVICNGFSVANDWYCCLLESTSVTLVQGIVSNITHIVLLLVLVGGLDMGYKGVCIASTA